MCKSSSPKEKNKLSSTDCKGITRICRQSYLDELKVQFQISAPTIIGQLFYKLPWLISLHFVGELGTEQLAAAALATTLCNVTGMSFSVGLSSAITTLTGQSRGKLLLKGEILEKRDKYQERNYGDKINKGSDEEIYVQCTTNESMPLLLSPNVENYDTRSITSDEKIVSTEALQPLVYLYRGIFIQMTLLLPIGAYWLYGIKPLLLFLGQNDELASMTEKYLRVLTPGLWSYSLNWTLTAWLQSIELVDVPAYIAFVGFVLHVPFNILFVRILDFGYIGVAMATVMFQLIQPVLMFIYLFGSACGTTRVLELTGAKSIGKNDLTFRKEMKMAIGSLSGIKQYLSLAIPGILAITEWWASEIAIFLAGQLEPNSSYSLGAMSIYQSINTFCFMFPVGFSTAATTRIGMFLGKDEPTNAALACRVAIFGAAVLSTVMSLILFFTPHTLIPSLFSPDEEIVLETSQTIPFLAVYVFADGIQTSLNGVIKGCGRQTIVVPIVIIAYWIVGLPLAYYISFVRNNGTKICTDDHFCGIVGLVVGMTTGTWIHMILLAITVVILINWKLESALAQQRILMDKS